MWNYARLNPLLPAISTPRPRPRTRRTKQTRQPPAENKSLSQARTRPGGPVVFFADTTQQADPRQVAARRRRRQTGIRSRIAAFRAGSGAYRPGIAWRGYTTRTGAGQGCPTNRTEVFGGADSSLPADRQNKSGDTGKASPLLLQLGHVWRPVTPRVETVYPDCQRGRTIANRHARG